MPKGQAAGTNKWNFHVKRLLCPVCGRKTAYEIFYSSGVEYACMYRSGYDKSCKSPVLMTKEQMHL